MRLFLRLNLFIVQLVFAAQLCAQQNSPVPIKTIPLEPNKHPGRDTIINNQKGVRQTDITEVLGRLFHVTPNAEVDSVSLKPTVSVAPAIGYTLISRLALVLSGNVAFRTGPQSRISTVIASTSYTQNRQFTLPIQTNIWSKDNRYNFIGDYRFYRYPQSTYGLGSNADIKNEDPMDYSYVEFYETALRHIAGNFYAGAGYIFDDHWNIIDKGNLSGSIPDYTRYGKTTYAISSGFTINALLDSRDNAINPMKGGYAAVQFRGNYEFLGSTSAWKSLIIDVRKYLRFPEESYNVIALWSYDWLILSGHPSYLDLPGTHWDFNSATGRGYIQSRFRGAQMIYAEGEYRFRITANGLLGGVFFVNGESFSAAPGTGLQRIQPGYGPGIRIKLNKVSNTNIKVDYGFGNQGSRGLFIDVGEAF